MSKALHDDSSVESINLSDEDYYKTYFDEGTIGGHEVPEHVLAEALERAEKRHA